MHKIVLWSTGEKEKLVLSHLIESILEHVWFAPEDTLKEYISWCYDILYLKEDKMHKSRKKERDYILKQEGQQLRETIYERWQRGYENAGIVGMKRTFERYAQKGGRPKKRKHR